MQCIERIRLEDRLSDNRNYITAGKCPGLQIYVMAVAVSWTPWYERYYRITPEDYRLFVDDHECFLERHRKEISQGRECYTENFLGADELRDYDGIDGFERAFPPRGDSAFSGFLYFHDMLCARIEWEEETIFVPPVRKIYRADGGEEYPLHASCGIKTGPDGKRICYKLNIDDVRL